MSHFFINNFSQADGSHEVHLLGCNRMPPDKRYLGNFYSVAEALIEARKDFIVCFEAPPVPKEQPKP